MPSAILEVMASVKTGLDNSASRLKPRKSQKPLEPSYPWQDAYFAVIFELDPAMRQQRIREAEGVMLRRARELTGGAEQDEERAILASFSARLLGFKIRAA